MKKIIKLLSTGLLFTALALNFAACKSETDDSASNELAGNKYIASYDDGEFVYTYDFKDETCVFTSYEKTFGLSSLIQKDVFTNIEKSFSYTLDTNTGCIISKLKSIKTSYFIDGKVIYTEPKTLPTSLADYKAEKGKFYKAIDSDLTEEELSNLISTTYFAQGKNIGAIDDSIYNNWKDSENKRRKTEKEFYQVFAYKLKGNTLIISCEEISYIPEGARFGEIFNGRYCYSFFDNGDEEYNYNRFNLFINFSTINGEAESIYLGTKGSNDYTMYTILEATDDYMKIAEGDYQGGYYTYSESPSQKINISYKEIKGGETATIKINGETYSFDIDYTDKEYVDECLSDESETIISTKM